MQLIYWVFIRSLRDGGLFVYLSTQTHGVVQIFLFFDFLFCTQWNISFVGSFWSYIIIITWIIVSIIFYLANWRNDLDNGRYIYSVVDWSPDKRIRTITLTCILLFGTFLFRLMWVWIKNIILKIYTGSRQHPNHTKMNTPDDTTIATTIADIV